MNKLLAAISLATAFAAQTSAFAQEYTINTLTSGQDLRTHQSLRSVNGQHTLTLQEDGNLCIYSNTGDSGFAFKWCAMSNGKNGKVLRMQADGNLVLYTAANEPVWNSKTHPFHDQRFKDAQLKPVRLELSNDGSLSLYNAAGSAVWSAK